MPGPFVLDANNAAPATDARAITPADGTDIPLAPCRSLWIGTAGNVAVLTAGGTTLTFTNVPVGLLQIQATRVLSTGTTASGIIALY